MELLDLGTYVNQSQPNRIPRAFRPILYDLRLDILVIIYDGSTSPALPTFWQ